MRARIGRTERAQQRVLRFRPCPSCTYNFATDEGERSCHYGACPYLPEQLDVHCPRCWYNFYTGEGRAECGDPPSCNFARDEAPVRIATVTRWLAQTAPRNIGEIETGDPRTP